VSILSELPEQQLRRGKSQRQHKEPLLEVKGCVDAVQCDKGLCSVTQRKVRRMKKVMSPRKKTMAVSVWMRKDLERLGKINSTDLVLKSGLLTALKLVFKIYRKSRMTYA